MISNNRRAMIVVQVAQNYRNIDLPLIRLKKLVRSICRRFEVKNATISVAIVDHEEMLKINNRFLNRIGTSDCLSFDLSDDTSSESIKYFEVIVNGEKAIEESRSRGHSAEAELALYITHGLLHNLGFNDSSIEQAQKMHQTEDEILQHFGYGLVYNNNTQS